MATETGILNAGITMIPSGYKSGKLYCQAPNDGGADLVVTRATVKNRVRKDGFMESIGTGVPQLDWLNSSCPFLRVEPAMTNLITDSEDITYYTTTTNVTLSANVTLAPDGTQTGDLIKEGTNNAEHSLSKASAAIIVGTNKYTYSFFAKAAGRTRFKILEDDSTVAATFNLYTASGGASATLTTGTAAKVENYGNGWFRCSVSYTAVDTGFAPKIQLLDDSGATPYLGDGGSGIYIWGSQLENSELTTTSYIQTSGGTAARNQDVIVAPEDATLFSNKACTLILKIRAFADDDTVRFISISDETANNVIKVGYSNSNTIIGVINVGGAQQVGMTYTSSDITGWHTVAIACEEDDFGFWVDGTEQDTDTSGLMFPAATLDRLRFDDGTGALDFYGDLLELKYFTRRLTDAELSGITTTRVITSE